MAEVSFVVGAEAAAESPSDFLGALQADEEEAPPPNGFASVDPAAAAGFAQEEVAEAPPAENADEAVGVGAFSFFSPSAAGAVLVDQALVGAVADAFSPSFLVLVAFLPQALVADGGAVKAAEEDVEPPAGLAQEDVEVEGGCSCCLVSSAGA